MRKTLIFTHRWVALVVSVFLLCAAASGTAMVFEGAIDRGLNPRHARRGLPHSDCNSTPAVNP